MFYLKMALCTTQPFGGFKVIRLFSSDIQADICDS